MKNEATDLELVTDSTQSTALPEAIAKKKKATERDKSRDMRRYFEQQREELELKEQLLDPFDYDDYDE